MPKKATYTLPTRRGDGAGPPGPRGRLDAQSSSNGRDESSGGDTGAKWRPSRLASGRDGSPADGPAPRYPPAGRRGLDGPGPRDSSPADGPGKYQPRFQRDGQAARSDTPSARTDSPASMPAPGPGKFVPIHLRNKQ